MAVPYTFANAAGYIPLSELDANFAAIPNYANTAGQVTNDAQPNIQTVGTLTSLTVTGNIVGNSAFIGNGALLTDISASGLGGDTLANTVLYSNLVTVGTLANLSVSGTITAGNLVANINGNINGNVTGSVVGNVTGNVIGNVAGNLSGLASLASVAYSVSAANVSGTVANATYATTSGTADSATTAGTVTTAAQPNITSVGSLTSLSVVGNITGSYFLGNGSQLTGLPENYSNANVAAFLPIYSANISAGNILTDNYRYANGVPVDFGNISTLNSNNLSYTAPFSGASTLTGTAKLSQFVSVLDFGADPTGSADSRNAFQAALNTGKHVYIPTGNYKINSGLQILNPGQMMSGDGRGVSVLQIGSEFNLSSTAVIDCSNIEPGAELRDFGITFTQPDTSNRASLTAYPVAIKATDAPRTTFQCLKIQGAINGINLTGNSGGAFIELFEMSAFGTGISIDGSYDTIRINKFHFWPYNLSSNQQTIFYSTGTLALSVGRVDGLFLEEFLNISNLGLYMFQSTLYGGDSQVFITNSAFDTNNGIVQTGGHLQVTNSYITVTTTSNLNGYIMSGTDTWAQFTNCWFLSGSPNQSMILMQDATNCTLSITQGHFVGPVANIPYIYVGASVVSASTIQVSDSVFAIGSTNSYVLYGLTPNNGTSTNFHLVNNFVQTNPNVAFSQPMFRFSNNNRISMTNNRCLDKGSGAGTFISIPTDNWNAVSLNVAPGWTMSFPTAVQGYYSNNPR